MQEINLNKSGGRGAVMELSEIRKVPAATCFVIRSLIQLPCVEMKVISGAAFSRVLLWVSYGISYFLEWCP